MDKTRLECDCVEKSVVNGFREPTLFRIILENFAGCNFFL